MNSITAIQNVSQVPSKLNKTETAVAANKLATARTINGTSFDGTANITTTNWGTTRNISIGRVTKTFNGGGDFSVSVQEIGASPAYVLDSSGYQGMTLNNGSTSGWIRTTDSGILPVRSGGFSSIGTSSWPFADIYANNFHGAFNGNATTATTATKLSTNAGHSTQPVYFSDGKPVATPSYFTRNTQGDIGWGSANNNSPVTVSAIAYWNGAYSGSASNLSYCIHGALGNIVTKNQGDYASASHNHNSSYLSLSGGTVSGKINTSQLAIGGRNLTISSSSPSAATGDIWIQI